MMDSFLQSMTFSRAEEFPNACDCDECDNVPPAIRDAIRERKRQRMETGPIKRTQQRTLVKRHGQISLWCMHMPKNAEPLIEFGSSHRIVWVQRLVKRNNDPNASTNVNDNSNATSNNILQWIGKGIIGSSDEEKSRMFLNDWTEGSIYLVPSNGGKAVGWIYTSATNETSNTDDAATTATITTTTDDDGDDDDAGAIKKDKEEHDDDVIATTKATESDGFAVLYVAKIPLDRLDQEQQELSKSDHQWVNPLIESCRKGLESCADKTNIPLYYKFSSEGSKLLKKAIRKAEGMPSNQDMKGHASKIICDNSNNKPDITPGTPSA